MFLEEFFKNFNKHFISGQTYEISLELLRDKNRIFYVVENSVKDLKKFYTFTEEMIKFTDIDSIDNNLFLFLGNSKMIELSFGDFRRMPEVLKMKKNCIVSNVLIGDQVKTFLCYVNWNINANNFYRICTSKFKIL